MSNQSAPTAPGLLADLDMFVGAWWQNGDDPAKLFYGRARFRQWEDGRWAMSYQDGDELKQARGDNAGEAIGVLIGAITGNATQ